MDSLPRSTKDRAKWWDTKRERWQHEWNQQNPFRQWQSRYGGEVKTEALRIIEDMHEKHVVGYKRKR